MSTVIGISRLVHILRTCREYHDDGGSKLDKAGLGTVAPATARAAFTTDGTHSLSMVEYV